MACGARHLQGARRTGARIQQGFQVLAVDLARPLGQVRKARAVGILVDPRPPLARLAVAVCACLPGQRSDLGCSIRVRLLGHVVSMRLWLKFKSLTAHAAHPFCAFHRFCC